MPMYLTYVTVSKRYLSSATDEIFIKKKKFRLKQRVAYASHGNFVIYGRNVHNRNTCALQNVTLKMFSNIIFYQIVALILKWFFLLYRLDEILLF